MKEISTPKADWIGGFSQAEWTNHQWQLLITDEIRELEEKLATMPLLEEERDALMVRCARQERYIFELEKQLELLQKTLDLIDKRGDGLGRT